MADTNNSNNVGSLLAGLLGILFVGLKLTGYIDWSWWWVLLPFYGGLVFAIGILLILLLINKFLK